MSKLIVGWVDGLTATLIREGINKHRAREIAQGYWEAYCKDDAEAAELEEKFTNDMLEYGKALVLVERESCALMCEGKHRTVDSGNYFAASIRARGES